MPTPKPGQIRCPTCHRPTPMAAFCTQCGAAIPPGAQARPRGMDRQELDARIRQRRPGDNRLRRGTPFDGGDAAVPGYVPFEPDPDDALAVREAGQQDQPHVDNTAPDFDERAAAEAARPLPPPPPVMPAEYASAPYPEEEEPEEEPAPAYVPPPQQAWEQPQYADAPEADEPYGAPEDAYPYAWEAAEEPRRGGGGLLPILGFAALAILALGVGAALAGMFTVGVADSTAGPTPTVAATASVASSVTESPTEGEQTATPEPTDGPVAFPDGATVTVQPCASEEMSFDGCGEDGSTITGRTMWVWIGFDDAHADDVFTLQLRSGGQTLDELEKRLGSLVTCERNGQPICSGYLIGAVYKDLDPGDYELIVRRNDDFADRAAFTVE